MVESRWIRRAGPGIAAIGAMVVVASSTAGAPPPSWDPPACVRPARPGVASIGAWYRLDPSIDGGVRTGQRLTLGRAGAERPAQIDLDAESFAAGPFAGTVLIGTDDGRSSTLSLIDLAGGCAWAVGTSADVIRHATLVPDGRSIVEFRVDRRSRADLGVWRRRLDGAAAPVRILGPIELDDRFGRTWRTELGWSDDLRTLVVETCGEVACRFRLLDLASDARQTIANPSVGDLVGLVDGHLIVHGACRGLPCPLLAVDRLDGTPVTLHEAAGQAVVARDELGRPVVVHEVGADGRIVRRITPDGRDAGAVADVPDGRRLVAGPAWAGGAAEHDPDWILFGPDGRLPIDGPGGAILRHVPDGATVRLDEVLP